MNAADKPPAPEFNLCLDQYNGIAHRVFAAVHPSQELLDDLLDEPAESEILKPLYYRGETPEAMTRFERIMARSSIEIIQQEINAKFSPQTWYASRYSDGTWPVLYTAASSHTAQRESLYHKQRFMHEELAKGHPIPIDLCEIKLTIESDSAADLTHMTLDQTKLISKDESGYPYCQAVARKARKAGAQLLRAPAARDPGGYNLPVFERSAIKGDSGPLRYLKCVLSQAVVEIFPGAWAGVGP